MKKHWFKRFIEKLRAVKVVEPVVAVVEEPVEDDTRWVKIESDPVKGVTTELSDGLTIDDALAIINRARMDLMRNANN